MHDPYACCEGTRHCAAASTPSSPLISRRGFLWGIGGASLAMTVLPALSLAEGEGKKKKLRARTGKRVLVPIFLRGGADFLNMVVPYGDPHYYKLRRSIAIPRPRKGAEGTADLDGFYGLHPALTAMLPLWNDGRLGVLQAVSHGRAGRSHFSEQDIWETGNPGNTIHSTGWLNRFLAEHTGSGPIRAVSFGSVLPRILRGDVPVQAVNRLEELQLTTRGDRRRRTLQALKDAYKDKGLLPETGRETLDAIRVLGKLKPRGYKPAHGATYPQTTLGQQMRQAAQLIKSDVGVEIVELELGGWDTHQNQGGVQGQQANLMRTLAGAVDAFVTDMQDHADDVLVVTMTEFGRTAAENGTGGTDHGHGNALMMIGTGIAGKKVHGAWPGLAQDKLNEKRDLAHTTDFRQVFAEVLFHHMGMPDPSGVLPGWKDTPTSLFKGI